MGLRLTVAAMGSIPHIVRREGPSPGDPRWTRPVAGNDTMHLAMHAAHGTELLERQQSYRVANGAHPKPTTIPIVLARELHASIRRTV